MASWFRKARQLLELHTFTPIWLPRWCRHPLIGYVVAIVLVILFALVEALLKRIFPTMEPLGIVEFGPVALVSFVWGIGPAIVATALGAILIDNFIHPLGTHWTLTISSVTATILFIGIGLFISGCICRLEHIYQRTYKLADELALERMHLETLVSSVPDSVIVYDQHGEITRLNPATIKMFGTGYMNAALANITRFYQIRTKDQQPLVPETLPITYALQGKTAETMEVEMCDVEDNILTVCINAAPIFDVQGTLTGCVAIFHNITKLRHESPIK